MASWLSRFGQTRRVLRALEQIAAAEQAQVRLLTQIAKVLAPEYSSEPAPSDTGVSFASEADQVQILDYVNRVRQATGRDPSDDEIFQFLADEAQAETLRHP